MNDRFFSIVCLLFWLCSFGAQSTSTTLQNPKIVVSSGPSTVKGLVAAGYGDAGYDLVYVCFWCEVFNL